MSYWKWLCPHLHHRGCQFVYSNMNRSCFTHLCSLYGNTSPKSSCHSLQGKSPATCISSSCPKCFKTEGKIRSLLCQHTHATGTQVLPCPTGHSLMLPLKHSSLSLTLLMLEQSQLVSRSRANTFALPGAQLPHCSTVTHLSSAC